MIYETVEIADLDQCAADFCNGGIQGYQDFSKSVFDWVRKYMFVFAILWCIAASFESILLVAAVGLALIDRQCAASSLSTTHSRP